MTETIGAAFVLGAGLGTRLRPLTAERPKPLVPVFHKPLIEFAFDHLRHAGVSRFVVNTHHCPEAYSHLLGVRDNHLDYAGCPVDFRHEPILLDTAGGIGNVRDLLGDEPCLVHNGDVLADLALHRLIEEHLASGNLATIGLRSKDGPLHVQFDPQAGRVTDIRGHIGGRGEPAYLFIGIYILSPALCRRIPPGQVLSIIPVLLDMIREGERVGGVVLDEGLWFDLGNRSSYLDAHRLFVGGRTLSYLPDSPWPQPVHPTARVAADAVLQGACAIGPHAVVGEGACLRDCVLWEGAKIAPGSRLESCIVRDGRHASGTLRDVDI